MTHIADLREFADAKPASHVDDVPDIQFIDHIAIAVPPGSLEPQVNAYALLGFREIHREEVLGSDQVREVLLQVGGGPNLLQLLEPLNSESPVAKMMAKNGGHGCLAHVAFRVENARTAFDAMRNKGFRIIDEEPRPGSRGTTVFFVHPKSSEQSALGVLIEIVEDGAVR